MRCNNLAEPRWCILFRPVENRSSFFAIAKTGNSGRVGSRSLVITQFGGPRHTESHLAVCRKEQLCA